MIDAGEIEKMVRSEIKAKVTEALSGNDVSDLLGSTMLQIANEKLDATVNGLLANMLKDGSLAKLVEGKLLKGLQEKLDEMVASRASGLVSRVDIGTQISDRITRFVSEAMERAALPDGMIPSKAVDTSDLYIPADRITQGTIREFSSTGIEDVASKIELTILDGSVIAENTLIAKSLSVEESAEIKGNINVMGDLRLQGDLVLLNAAFAKQIQGMVKDTLAEEKAANKMDIGGSALYANGKMILQENALGSSVALSNLRKVGNLQDLNVIGPLTACDTLSVASNRVGINTDDPAGALTIWDEDAELTVRKHKAKTTYIGTTRDCDLVIGTNGSVGISLRRDGTAAVHRIELGGILISVDDAIPERDGQLGELVIMRHAKEGQPWAYQCMEGKRWAALKR